MDQLPSVSLSQPENDLLIFEAICFALWDFLSVLQKHARLYVLKSMKASL